METVYISLHRKPDECIRENDRNSEREDLNLIRFALQMCRKHGLVKDRVTLLSPSDFLQVLQLCHAQVYKKIDKSFQSADNTTVVAMAQSVYEHKLRKAIKDIHQHLLNATGNTDNLPLGGKDFSDQASPGSRLLACETENNVESERLHEKMLLSEYDEFLASCNHIDAVDVLRIFLLELLDSQSQSELHAEIASMGVEIKGCPADPLQALIAEQLKHCKKDEEESKRNCEVLETCLRTCTTDKTAVKPLGLSHDSHLRQPDEHPEKSSKGDDSITKDTAEELVHEIFQSYLNLLVNTRSELSFAHIFNVPERDLTHHAFTHLKHQAQKKKMSLYQMAASVVTQLRLGGRGYAPDPNSRLLEHIKGLGLLTDLMDKLQQLLEDTQCVRSSVLRVVGAIKKNLTGCKSQRYQRETVEAEAEKIQKDLEQVLTELQFSGSLISPDKPACQGGSLTSRRPRRVLLHYLDRCAATLWGARNSAHYTWLNDIPFGPHTPSRFPCVLSQFRSPVVTCSSPSHDKRQKEEQGQKKRKLTVSTNLMPDDIDQPLLQRSSKRLCDTVIVLPSKTIVHPAQSRPSLQVQEPDSQDKENSNTSGSPVKKKGKKSSTINKKKTESSSVSAAPLGVAVMENGQPDKSSSQQNSSQQSKPRPKQDKKCRRRLLQPIKGQKQITSFFRV